MKSDLPGDFSNRRSNVNFTSAEVISCPSWNLTPWRSLKVHVSPSLLTSQDSASSGCGFISGSRRTSWLYIMGERRLRENAGTSWGSRPVASLFWAEMKTPPGLGVCASAGRPRASAPAARPPAWRSWRRGGRRGAAERASVVMVVLLYCALGSRMSRRPSPRRLNASTVTMIAMPGNTEIHGAVSRYVRPSLSMLPHDGVGGWADRPRYDSEASMRMAWES